MTKLISEGMPLVIKKISFSYNGFIYKTWDSLIEAVYQDVILRGSKETLKKILEEHINRNMLYEGDRSFEAINEDLENDLEDGSIEWIISPSKQFWLF